MLALFPVDATNVPIRNKAWYDCEWKVEIVLKLHRWIGEKYDGVRLCWNVNKQKAYQ